MTLTLRDALVVETTRRETHRCRVPMCRDNGRPVIGYITALFAFDSTGDSFTDGHEFSRLSRECSLGVTYARPDKNVSSL